MTADTAVARKRGRPPAARTCSGPRCTVTSAAGRVDVQAIAAELGLGRATIYRWFGVTASR